MTWCQKLLKCLLQNMINFYRQCCLILSGAAQDQAECWKEESHCDEFSSAAAKCRIYNGTDNLTRTFREYYRLHLFQELNEKQSEEEQADKIRGMLSGGQHIKRDWPLHQFIVSSEGGEQCEDHFPMYSPVIACSVYFSTVNVVYCENVSRKNQRVVIFLSLSLHIKSFLSLHIKASSTSHIEKCSVPVKSETTETHRGASHVGRDEDPATM